MTEGDATVTVSYGFDFVNTANNDLDAQDITVSGQSLWDVAQWDEAVWDGPEVYDQRLPVHNSRIHRWSTVKFINYLADQSVEYDGLDKIFQVKGIR